MSCYNPIRAFKTPTGVVFQELARHDTLYRLDIPCGQCTGCRIRRASDWELRILHEAALYEQNCAITLTYTEENLPPNNTLQHRDFQLFIKRLRKQTPNTQIRYYMCGEYGEEKGRPHYHACMFNLSFADRIPAGKSGANKIFYTSPKLTQIWGLGKTSIQDLTKETAAYCCRYILTKQLGRAADLPGTEIDPETGEITQKKPEYSKMSLKPGLGKTWFDKYKRDVYPHDFVISRGDKRRPPKYYDQQLHKTDPAMIEYTQYLRAERGRQHHADNTPERLKVRETVANAKINAYKRNLE